MGLKPLYSTQFAKFPQRRYWQKSGWLYTYSIRLWLVAFFLYFEVVLCIDKNLIIPKNLKQRLNHKLSLCRGFFVITNKNFAKIRYSTPFSLNNLYSKVCTACYVIKPQSSNHV